MDFGRREEFVGGDFTPSNTSSHHGDIPLPSPSGDSPEHRAATEYRVIRRDGSVIRFDANKITVAVSKAFIAVEGVKTRESERMHDITRLITDIVTDSLFRRRPLGGSFHIEEIQDQVELALMRNGHHEIARAYVLYREERARARAESASKLLSKNLRFIGNNGKSAPLEGLWLKDRVERACRGIDGVDSGRIISCATSSFYDEMHETALVDTLILATRELIEKEPAYSRVAAQLLLDKLRCEAFGQSIPHSQMMDYYPQYLAQSLDMLIDAELLDPALARTFDIGALGRAIKPDRDLQFNYLGLQTLYDRYFLHIDGKRIEMPQTFFMRVAMGLALGEAHPTRRAIEFYDLLSSFRFMSSTPTLFNAGTTHPQLSSCYLTTVGDDLANIFGAYQENALLAKFAGGLGNDWSPVRAMGSRIKGTNGKSQGVIPFLKIVNDTAVAVNQGGKRKGAVCTYLETWHADIEEFLELRKNTGDERRRTHDMNTANWVPDLFMRRVCEDGQWTLFSPVDVPDLHDLYGDAFERAYVQYEKRFDEGLINGRRMRAVVLWRKMLTMLYETGHPWITFKDPCNIRSPQSHAGVVHSSNLCTEITLNTGAEEIAVCNLGSVNLVAHMKEGDLDEDAITRTVTTAVRMLDNVIDLNMYPVEKARTSNMRHRPIGLGIMGFADCLHEMNIPYNCDEAIAFADRSMETVAYRAYWASATLAQERGRYPSYEGSLWSKGLLPPDSLQLLAKSRGVQEDIAEMSISAIDSKYFSIDTSAQQDWDALRAYIAKHGMRNSNCVAIAPTATIANIVGVSPSIEPNYQNIYVKSNLSGDFTVCNQRMVEDLKKLNLWDEVMIADIKYFDGRIEKIDRIPQDIKDLYKTAFDIDPIWLIDAAARRQKWIDQSQSLNLYIAESSGKKLDQMYKHAWRCGLKTTYYLRSMGASSTEKYTAPTGSHNAVAANGHLVTTACNIDDPDCEACQ